MTVVSELVSKFRLQVDPKGFAKADNAVNKLITSARTLGGTIAGAFAFRAVAGFTRELIKAGDNLDKIGIQLGIATRSLQELRFAGDLAGVSAQQLDNTIQRLSLSAFEASRGVGEYAEVYRILGVNVEEADGQIKDSETIFLEVATAISKIESPTKRSGLAMRVFGRQGGRLLPLLNKGAEGVEELRQRFRDLGGGFSQEFIDLAADVTDQLAEVALAARSFKGAVGEVLLPIVSRALELFLDFTVTLNKLLKGTQVLRIGFFALAAASTVAAIATLKPWLAPIATFALIAFVIAGVVAALDDLLGLISGKKSLIGEFIDSWLGVGTVNTLVRRWSDGVKILGENMDSLVQSALEVAEIIKLIGKGEFSEALSRGLDLAKESASSLVDSVNDAGDAVFGPGPVSFARAAGRGIDAPLESVEFGRANQSSVAPFLRGGTAQGTAASNAANITQTANVTVNAASNSDPNQIAAMARREVNDVLNVQNKNVRNALGGRARR